jgi:hypothetical protein
MVWLYYRGLCPHGSTLVQECLSPLGCEFANRPPLADLLADVPQELYVFVIKLAVPIASALRLEQVIAFFPHTQEFRAHSKHTRYSLDAVVCHALTFPRSSFPCRREDKNRQRWWLLGDRNKSVLGGLMTVIAAFYGGLKGSAKPLRVLAGNGLS